MIAITRLLLIAAVVRGSYLATSLLLARYLDDYDTSSKLLSESCGDDWPELVVKTQQNYPWVLWDSVFFQRISTCGYEFEQYYAFFPGLPGLVHLIRQAGIVNGPNAFTVITLLLNNALFLLSVVLLARLSELILQDDKLSITSVLLFIATPASIHHSMMYTEALFTASRWLGLYFLYCKGSSLGASLAFAMSSATRSNGLLNAGFILHKHGKAFLKSWQHSKATALIHACKAAAYSAVVMAPYFIYMAYGYQQFCTGVYGGDNKRPWCSKLLPSAYGYVQDVYWDVGFLRYYRLSQVPNFLIAGPTLIISLWGSLAYACGSPHSFMTGGLLLSQQLSKWFSRCRNSCSAPSQQKGLQHGHVGCSSASSGNRGEAGAAGCRTGCILLWSAVPGWQEYICSSEAAGQADVPGVRQGEFGDAELDTAGANGAQCRSAAVSEVAYQALRPRKLKAAESIPGCQQQQTAARAATDSNTGNCSSSVKAARVLQPCTCAEAQGYYSPDTAVFVIHWLFLTLVCLAVMHIQVATRFLSSCVPLYWFAALLIRHRSGWLSWLLWLYCFAFMGLGAVYFTNFYPWT